MMELIVDAIVKNENDIKYCKKISDRRHAKVFITTILLCVSAYVSTKAIKTNSKKIKNLEHRIEELESLHKTATESKGE